MPYNSAPRTEMRCRACDGYSSAQVCWSCSEKYMSTTTIDPLRSGADLLYNPQGSTVIPGGWQQESTFIPGGWHPATPTFPGTAPPFPGHIPPSSPLFPESPYLPLSPWPGFFPPEPLLPIPTEVAPDPGLKSFADLLKIIDELREGREPKDDFEKLIVLAMEENRAKEPAKEPVSRFDRVLEDDEV